MTETAVRQLPSTISLTLKAELLSEQRNNRPPAYFERSDVATAEAVLEVLTRTLRLYFKDDIPEIKSSI